MNERHLLGADAPDWILFDLQSIDGRLPSLDDGLSWVAFLDNYEYVSYDGRFTYLRRRKTVDTSGSLKPLLKQVCRTGSIIAIPAVDGLLFAKVNLKPTLAGKASDTFFNAPEIRILISLSDGSIRKFRVVPNMMETEFLLSPMVTDTSGFASVMAGDWRAKRLPTVRSMSILPAYGGTVFWSASYRLTLEVVGADNNGPDLSKGKGKSDQESP